jgi:hypothetical protein
MMKLKLELALVALSAMIVTTGSASASVLSSSEVRCDSSNSSFILKSAGSDSDQTAYISDDDEVRCESRDASRGKGKGIGRYGNGKKAYSDVLGTSGKQPETVGRALLSVQCKGRGEGMICTGGGLAPVESGVVVAKDLGDIGDDNTTGTTGKDPVDGGRPGKGSSPVPEPTAALLFGAGLVVAGAATRRKAA